MTVQQRPFGASGLTTSVLGFGAMQIGDPAIAEVDASRVLHGVLDLGLRLIDTACSYGVAEERIGRHLAARRDEFLLSTKVGYGVPGVQDWTPECVRLGIDQARARLATDVIDIVHLHSCDSATLRSGVIDVLQEARERGKIRVAAYAGDGGPLAVAAGDSRVGALQLSLNLCDRDGAAIAADAAARGVGVIVKRSLLGLPWRRSEPPADPPHAEYFRRFQRFAAEYGGADWQDLALRFAAFADGVACCIVGGVNLAHVSSNVESIARGPLAADTRAALANAYCAADDGWHGIV